MAQQQFSRNTKLFITFLFFTAGTLFVHAELTRGTHKALRAKVAWSDNLEATLAAAARSGKPVMLDFFSPACDSCQEYKDEVFCTEEFQDLATKFELVEVNLNTQPELMKKYDIGDLPDIRFLKDGKMVNRVNEFEDTESLLTDMRKAL